MRLSINSLGDIFMKKSFFLPFFAIAFSCFSLFASCGDDSTMDTALTESNETTGSSSMPTTGVNSSSSTDEWLSTGTSTGMEGTGGLSQTSGFEESSTSATLDTSSTTMEKPEEECNPLKAKVYDQYGKGIPGNPYQICSALQLIDLAEQDELENYPAMEASYALMNDIDVSNVDKNITIGDKIPFIGSFGGKTSDDDEKIYAIIGLNNAKHEGGGLFHWISGNAVIENLIIRNANLYSNAYSGIFIDSLVDFSGRLENLTIEDSKIQAFTAANTEYISHIGGIFAVSSYSGPKNSNTPIFRKLSAKNLSINYQGFYRQIEKIGGIFGRISDVGLPVVAEHFKVEMSSINVSSNLDKTYNFSATIGGIGGWTEDVVFSAAVSQGNTINLHRSAGGHQLDRAVIGGIIGQSDHWLSFQPGVTEEGIVVPSSVQHTQILSDASSIVGGVVGYSFDDCAFDQVESVSLKVTLPWPINNQSNFYTRIGGIAGVIDNKKLTSVMSTVVRGFKVVTGLQLADPNHLKRYTIGGLIGEIQSSNTVNTTSLLIKNTYAQVQYGSNPDFNINKGTWVLFGGLVGEAVNDFGSVMQQISILNSFAHLKANSAVKNSGGLVQSSEKNLRYYIHHSYAAGKASILGGYNNSISFAHGGLIRYLPAYNQPNNASVVENSWTAIEYTQAESESPYDPNNVGGILGNLDDMQGKVEGVSKVFHSPVTSLNVSKLNEKNFMNPVNTCISSYALNSLQLQDIQGCIQPDDSVFKSEPQLKAIIPTWNFKDIWEYAEGYPYPLLREHADKKPL